MAIFSCERLRTCTQFDTMPQGLIYAPQSRNLWGVIFLYGVTVMKKYKFWAEYGFAGTRQEEIVEYETELTEEQLEEEAKEFFWNSANLGYGYEEVED